MRLPASVKSCQRGLRGDERNADRLSMISGRFLEEDFCAALALGDRIEAERLAQQKDEACGDFTLQRTAEGAAV